MESGAGIWGEGKGAVFSSENGVVSGGDAEASPPYMDFGDELVRVDRDRPGIERGTTGCDGDLKADVEALPPSNSLTVHRQTVPP